MTTPGFWLGSPGSLIPLPNIRGDLSVQGYPRDWSVSLPSATPDEVAALYAMAAHDVQFTTDLAGTRRARVSPTSPADVGPFHWVTPHSRVTNLLPPRSVSGPEGWVGSSRSQGGPVALVDGMAASSVQVGAGGVSYSPLVPVVPGVPVSMGVYARAAAGTPVTMSIDWMALGAAQSDPAMTVAASREWSDTAAPLDRMVLAATPPSNVHLARLTMRNAVQFAMPTVTWTSQVQARSAGQGCASAIVHGLSSDPTLARDGAAYESVSFTVSEVG